MYAPQTGSQGSLGSKTVVDCSEPLIVTQPVLAVDGAVTDCSLPPAAAQPVPGVALVVTADCSLPLTIAEPVPGVPGDAAPPGSSTSIRRPSASLVERPDRPVSSVPSTVGNLEHFV